jgi:hypothetical protein
MSVWQIVLFCLVFHVAGIAARRLERKAENKGIDRMLRDLRNLNNKIDAHQLKRVK